jgi:hypothetical protein
VGRLAVEAVQTVDQIFMCREQPATWCPLSGKHVYVKSMDANMASPLVSGFGCGLAGKEGKAQ